VRRWFAELILACGDLPSYYLEYIVSLLDRPLYYVHGNHDKASMQPADPGAMTRAMNSALLRFEPDPRPAATGLGWAVNLHRNTARFQGLLLAGLEGCRAYNPGAPYQYSESQVQKQVLSLGLRLLANRLRYGRCLDILITHAPPRGIHDGDDLPHRGFESYLTLLRRFQPRLMIHGHQHVYNRNETAETDYDGTRIINTFGYRVLELAPRQDAPGWDLVSSSK
jgi:hypothetical protein